MPRHDREGEFETAGVTSGAAPPENFLSFKAAAGAAAITGASGAASAAAAPAWAQGNQGGGKKRGDGQAVAAPVGSAVPVSAAAAAEVGAASSAAATASLASARPSLVYCIQAAAAAPSPESLDPSSSTRHAIVSASTVQGGTMAPASVIHTATSRPGVSRTVPAVAALVPVKSTASLDGRSAGLGPGAAGPAGVVSPVAATTLPLSISGDKRHSFPIPGLSPVEVPQVCVMKQKDGLALAGSVAAQAAAPVGPTAPLVCHPAGVEPVAAGMAGVASPAAAAALPPSISGSKHHVFPTPVPIPVAGTKARIERAAVAPGARKLQQFPLPHPGHEQIRSRRGKGIRPADLLKDQGIMSFDLPVSEEHKKALHRAASAVVGRAPEPRPVRWWDPTPGRVPGVLPRFTADRSGLPDTPGDWAADIDLALNANGEWAARHADCIEAFNDTLGALVIHLCSGAVTSAYKAYIGGLKTGLLVACDIDENGDGVNEVGDRLVICISDHAKQALSAAAIRDLRCLGNDVFLITPKQLDAVLDALKGVPVLLDYEWPCYQNSLAKRLHKLMPGCAGRYTDKVLEACLRIRDHLQLRCTQQGRPFVALGENTAMWVPGYGAYERLGSEVIARRKAQQVEWVRECCGLLGALRIFESAFISGSHRLRDVYGWNIFIPPLPLVQGRDLVDVLSDGFRPQECKSTSTFPWAPGNVRKQLACKLPTCMRRLHTWSNTGSEKGKVVELATNSLVVTGRADRQRVMGLYAAWAGPEGLLHDPNVPVQHRDLKVYKHTGNMVDGQLEAWNKAHVLHHFCEKLGLAKPPVTPMSAPGQLDFITSSTPRTSVAVALEDGSGWVGISKAANSESRKIRSFGKMVSKLNGPGSSDSNSESDSEGESEGGSDSDDGGGSVSGGDGDSDGGGGDIGGGADHGGGDEVGDRGGSGGGGGDSSGDGGGGGGTEAAAPIPRRSFGPEPLGFKASNPIPPPTAGEEVMLRQGALKPFLQGEWEPAIDTMCDKGGVMKQRGCTEWLCRERPLQHNVAAVVGKVFVSFPPFGQAEEVVASLQAAIHASPTTTRGTVVLSAKCLQQQWGKRHYSRKRPTLTPAGRSHVIRRGKRVLRIPRNDGKGFLRAPFPLRDDLLVLRMGLSGADILQRQQEAVANVAALKEQATRQRAAAAHMSESERALASAEEARSLAAAAGVVVVDDEESLSELDSGDEYEDEMRHDGVTQRDKEEWKAAKLAVVPLLLAASAARGLGWNAAMASDWANDCITVNKDPKAWYDKPSPMAGSVGARLDLERWKQWEAFIAPDEWGAAGAEAIDIISNGASTAVAYDVGWSEVPNHDSCEWYKDRITGELQFYEESGIHEFLPEGMDVKEFVARLNPCLVVCRTPDDGKGRLCVNMSAGGYNDACVSRPYQQTSPKKRLALVESDFFQFREDLRKAYMQVILDVESRRATGFIHPISGRVTRHTGLAFGRASSPADLYIIVHTACGIFRQCVDIIIDVITEAGGFNALGLCNTSGAAPGISSQCSQAWRGTDAGVFIADFMRAARSLDPYVDDFCACGRVLALALLDGILILEGDKLGMQFDPSKAIAARRLVSLGALIQAPECVMRIQVKKARSYAAYIEQEILPLESKRFIKRKLLERLRGKLGFVASLTRWASAFLIDIDEALYPLCRKAGPAAPHCPVGVSFWESLKLFWMPFLAAPGAAAWLSISQWEVRQWSLAMSEPHFIITTDAAGAASLGAGAVSDIADYARSWEQHEAHNRIVYKELTAVVDGVEAEAKRYAGHRVLAECDNWEAVSYLCRGRGKQQLGNAIILRLAWLCIKLGIAFRAIHRPGKFMMRVGSDPLSRAVPTHSGRKVQDLAAAAAQGRQLAGEKLVYNDVNMDKIIITAWEVQRSGEVPARDMSHTTRKKLSALGSEQEVIKFTAAGIPPTPGETPDEEAPQADPSGATPHSGTAGGVPPTLVAATATTPQAAVGEPFSSRIRPYARMRSRVVQWNNPNAQRGGGASGSGNNTRGTAATGGTLVAVIRDAEGAQPHASGDATGGDAGNEDPITPPAAPPVGRRKRSRHERSWHNPNTQQGGGASGSGANTGGTATIGGTLVAINGDAGGAQPHANGDATGGVTGYVDPIAPRYSFGGESAAAYATFVAGRTVHDVDGGTSGFNAISDSPPTQAAPALGGRQGRGVRRAGMSGWSRREFHSVGASVISRQDSRGVRMASGQAAALSSHHDVGGNGSAAGAVTNGNGAPTPTASTQAAHGGWGQREVPRGGGWGGRDERPPPAQGSPSAFVPSEYQRAVAPTENGHAHDEDDYGYDDEHVYDDVIEAEDYGGAPMEADDDDGGISGGEYTGSPHRSPESRQDPPAELGEEDDAVHEEEESEVEEKTEEEEADETGSGEHEEEPDEDHAEGGGR